MAASSNKKAVPSGKVYLQVVGTDSVDTSPSLLVFTDSQRYLFNCGEGTQRLFNENKLRLNKLNNMFFTQITWESIGGLPGMAMTLRDNGRANLGLYGPENIKDFIKATRFFLFHEKLHFECVGYGGDENQDVYSDENMTIWPVLLTEEKKEPMINEEEKENSPKRVKLDLFANQTIACYICKLATLPGKFLVQKAKELGVPKGPLFGKLKVGEDVTLENGVKVLAEQVKAPDQEGPVFFIIDCPSTKYLPGLVKSQRFFKYQDESKQQPCLIVHLVPMDVFNDPRYENWRKRFGSSTQHLLINKEVCSKAIVFQSQTRIEAQLHTIDATLFPLLHYSDIPTTDPRSLPTNTKPGEFFLKFHLRPLKQQGYDRSGMQELLDFDKIMEETNDLLKNIGKTEHQSLTEEHVEANDKQDTLNLDTSQAMPEKDSDQKLEDKNNVGKSTAMLLSEKEVRTEVNFSNDKCEDDENVTIGECAEQKDFEIVFLGTGASLPSKYRNVSAALINISRQSSLLLDCGEGTLGQLYRHYGNNMDDVMARLKCVFISHIHADHHLGLPRILLYKEKLNQGDSNDNNILVVGPAKINLWLQEYSLYCQQLHYRFIDCSQILQADHERSEEFHCVEANQVLAVPVDHCAQAYGLVLEHASGWKVVYSGDTRPCPALIRAGRNATVLIHEATFEDVLKEEALDKKHSTTTEAITSGIEMNARFTLLNHFSQRYPKIPVFSEKFTKHTGIAFDHMRVRLADVTRIPRLVAPLNVLFADEVEDMSKRSKTSTCPVENVTEVRDGK